MRVNRYLAIVEWSRKRYTVNGLLTVSIGHTLSIWSRIERSAWSKYMEVSA